MAYTEAQIESKIAALEVALDRHEQAVAKGDRSVSYKSVEEVERSLAYWKGLLRSAQGRGKQSFGYAEKGFGC